MTTEKEIAAIQALTNEEIAELKLWEAMAFAMPYGVATEVAEAIGLPARTVQSWRVDPELVPTGSLRDNDPSGRRGLGYQFNLYLLALNGCFPPGAQFLLRYYALKLAKGQSIQGHERMKAVLHLENKMRELGEEMRSLVDQFAALTSEATETRHEQQFVAPHKVAS